MQKTAAAQAALNEKPRHYLHHSMLLQLIDRKKQADESTWHARHKRIVGQRRLQQERRLQEAHSQQDNGAEPSRSSPAALERPTANNDPNSKERDRMEYEAYDRTCSLRQGVNGLIFSDEVGFPGKGAK